MHYTELWEKFTTQHRTQSLKKIVGEKMQNLRENCAENALKLHAICANCTQIAKFANFAKNCAPQGRKFAQICAKIAC